MGGKASFTGGTCRFKTAFNLCLTSLQDTFSLAVGGRSIADGVVAVSSHPGGTTTPNTMSVYDNQEVVQPYQGVEYNLGQVASPVPSWKAHNGSQKQIQFTMGC